MERDESSSSSFPMGETAQEKGFSHVPQCYTIPTSHRPSLNPETGNVHVVDWAALSNPDQRSDTINEIKDACSRSGCFQASLSSYFYILCWFPCRNLYTCTLVTLNFNFNSTPCY